jgi:hypothetical protein
LEDAHGTISESDMTDIAGNSEYSDEFISAWHKLVVKEEVEELHIQLLKFVEKNLRMVSEHDKEEIRKMGTNKKI